MSSSQQPSEANHIFILFYRWESYKNKVSKLIKVTPPVNGKGSVPLESPEKVSHSSWHPGCVLNDILYFGRRMTGICLHDFPDREISQVKVKKAQGWERVRTTFEERWMARDETRKTSLGNERLECHLKHLGSTLQVLSYTKDTTVPLVLIFFVFRLSFFFL